MLQSICTLPFWHIVPWPCAHLLLYLYCTTAQKAYAVCVPRSFGTCECSVPWSVNIESRCTLIITCAAYIAYMADVPWSYRSLLPSFSLPVRAAIIRPNLKPESKKFSGPDWLIDWRHQSCHQLMGWELENKASKFNVGRAMSEDIFGCACVQLTDKQCDEI